jgi:hypothetical protein
MTIYFFRKEMQNHPKNKGGVTHAEIHDFMRR